MKLIVPDSIKDVKVSSIVKKYSEKLKIITNAILEINSNNEVIYTKLENRLKHCYNDIAIYLSSMVGISITYNYNRQEFKFTLKNGTDATCQFRIKEDYKWGQNDADGKTIVNYIADFGYSHCSSYNTSEYFYLCYNILRLVENDEQLIVNAIEAYKDLNRNNNELNNKIYKIEEDANKIKTALNTMISFEGGFRNANENNLYSSKLYNVSHENIIQHCEQLISEMNSATTFGNVLEWFKECSKPKEWKNMSQRFEEYYTKTIHWYLENNIE